MQKCPDAVINITTAYTVRLSRSGLSQLAAMRFFPPLILITLPYAIFTFSKVRRKSEWSIHAVNCVCRYTRDSSRNAKCNTQELVTAPTPVLSPSSILPPTSCHCAFISARKNSPRVSEVLLINFKNFISIKSRNLELLLSREVSCL